MTEVIFDSQEEVREDGTITRKHPDYSETIVWDGRNGGLQQ